jgi:hypothetical protein
LSARRAGRTIVPRAPEEHQWKDQSKDSKQYNQWLFHRSLLGIKRLMDDNPLTVIGAFLSLWILLVITSFWSRESGLRTGNLQTAFHLAGTGKKKISL